MTTPQRKIRSHRRYREFRARALSLMGDVCWLCHHPGARDLDHVIPLSRRPELALSIDNVRPAHGVLSRCPTCGRACNQSRNGRRNNPWARWEPKVQAGRVNCESCGSRIEAGEPWDLGRRGPKHVSCKSGTEPVTRSSVPLVDRNGCPQCHGAECSNGVPEGPRQLLTRCW